MNLKSNPALRSTAPPLYRCSAAIAGSALLFMVFAQPGLEAQQGPQYAGSQYIQPAPNYIANSQYKPTPYRYPQQVAPRQQAQQYAPQGSQDEYAQEQGYPQQQQAYPQQQYPPQRTYPQQQAQDQLQYQDPGYDPGQSDSGQADPNQTYADQTSPMQGQGGGGQLQQTGQPFAADQLAQLVAPIALYPDNLVAQILAASTYPAQIIAADNWLRSMGRVSPDQVAAGASAQTGWDPSIKALTAFPQVLAMLDHDIRWATDLGNAYYNQPQDVLQAIQVMRQRAQSAGTLQNTAQEQVYNNQGYIQLAPANPQVVYVPAYNPWLAYGAPINPYPGFSLLDAIGSVIGTGLRFGAGIGLNAFMNTPFGWAGWALNWLASSIFFNHSPYYSHSMSVAHWGGRGGGYYARGGGINRDPRGFSRGERFGNERGFGERGFSRVPGRQENYAFNRGGDGLTRGFGNERGFSNQLREPARDFGGSRLQGGPSRPESYARPGGSGYLGSSPRSFGGSYYGGSTQHAFAEPHAFSGGSSFGRGFGQSYHEPKMSGGSHSFGGGGHQSFKAPKAPKMSGGGGGHHGGGGGGGGGHHHGK